MDDRAIDLRAGDHLHYFHFHPTSSHSERSKTCSAFVTACSTEMAARQRALPVAVADSGFRNAVSEAEEARFAISGRAFGAKTHSRTVQSGSHRSRRASTFSLCPHGPACAGSVEP